MNRFMNQSGFGTVTAIIMVAVLSAMIVVLGPMMDQTARANKQTKDEVDAQFAAEAGIQYALAITEKNSNAVKSLAGKKGKLENGAEWELNLSGPDVGNTYTINSRGTAGSVKKLTRDMSVRIKINDDLGVFGKYVLYSGDKLSFSAASQVYEKKDSNDQKSILGKMGALGDIYLNVYKGENLKLGFDRIDGIKESDLSGYVYTGEEVSHRKEPAWYTAKQKDEIGTIDFDGELDKRIQKWTYNDPENKPDSKVCDSMPQPEKLSGTLSEKLYSADSKNYNISKKDINLKNTENRIMIFEGGLDLNTGSKIDANNLTIFINDGNLALSNSTIKAKNLTIYINGSGKKSSLNLNSSSNIEADSVKIYAKKGIALNSNSKIIAKTIEFYTEDAFYVNSGATINPDEKSYSEAELFKVYAYSIDLTNSSNINADLIEFQIDGDGNGIGDFSITSGEKPSLNGNLPDGTVKIYGRGCAKITNNAVIGCDAIVEFGNSIEIQNQLDAERTIFIAGNLFRMGGSAKIAGAYAIHSLTIEGGSSCEINALGIKNDILRKFRSDMPSGGGNSKPEIEDGSWKLNSNIEKD